MAIYVPIVQELHCLPNCLHVCMRGFYHFTKFCYSIPYQHQSSAGDRGPVARVGGRVGKSGKSGVSHGKGEGHVVHAGVNCVCNVCGSARSCGCVVNGSFARAAF